MLSPGQLDTYYPEKFTALDFKWQKIADVQSRIRQLNGRPLSSVLPNDLGSFLLGIEYLWVTIWSSFFLLPLLDHAIVLLIHL